VSAADTVDRAGTDGRDAGPQRLDLALVARGLADSRSRARDLVLRGRVTVDGKPAAKPSATVAAGAALALTADAPGYVSRAAEKLVAGLAAFGFDPAGRFALDLGASTGGFTEVLLARGARAVVAVDVGHGQLHPRIAADPRVTAIEGLNARALTADDVREGGAPAAPEAIVADLSFISLKLALPPALGLAAPGAWGVFLVKPQFEVGRDGVGKGGIVRDPALAEAAAQDLAAWLGDQPGWRVAGLVPSPIEGGDGNREFLLGATRTDDTP
jgi:23S rRNA (cytidine1920-2'-O)/16S rRNA (cytidine1409-2'-O)-methyltransferase